jgi:hypothetical protein
MLPNSTPPAEAPTPREVLTRTFQLAPTLGRVATRNWSTNLLSNSSRLARKNQRSSTIIRIVTNSAAKKTRRAAEGRSPKRLC